MKINLLKQKSTKFKKAELIRRINLSVVIGTVVAFLIAVAYITADFVYLRFRSNELSSQLTNLERTYNSRATEVVNYLRMKQVVTNIKGVEAKRFGYRDFLLAIYRMLPERARLATVEFSQEGVIAFSVRLENPNDYEQLLQRVKSESESEGFSFKNVALRALSRGEDGLFLASLEIRIK